MAIAGYLEIPDIAGETKSSQHRDQIEIHGIAWMVERSTSGGSTHHSAAADVGPIVLDKFYDASSPHLALAAMNGRAFAEMRLHVETAASAHHDYLRITLRDCVVSGIELLAPVPGDEAPGLSARKRRMAAGPIRERVTIRFVIVGIVYTAAGAGGSAGAGHEIEWDISANA